MFLEVWMCIQNKLNEQLEKVEIIMGGDLGLYAIVKTLMHNIGRLRKINVLQTFKVGFHMPTKFVRLLRKSINELKHVLNKFGHLFRKHEYLCLKQGLNCPSGMS
jgi:hypothetical protein